MHLRSLSCIGYLLAVLFSGVLLSVGMLPAQAMDSFADVTDVHGLSELNRSGESVVVFGAAAVPKGESHPLLDMAPAATAVKNVGTSAELSQGIASAQAGDRIVVAPGNYSLAASIKVAPLIIEAQSAQDRPVLSIASGSTMLTVDAGPVTGVVIRNLVFNGKFQAVSAIRAKATGVTIEGCQFNDFESQADPNPIINIVTFDDQSGGHQMQPCVVRNCRFIRTPHSRAIYSVGPTTVEDSTFENIRYAMYLTDTTGYSASSQRLDHENIVRRNLIYRTQGTTWNCRGIVIKSTAPKIYGNRIHDTTIGEGCETIVAIGNDLPGTPTRAEIYRNVIIAKWKAADSGIVHEGIEYGEPPGDYGLIYENVLVGYLRPGIYNKGNHNRWFNNTTYCTDPDGYTFHCYGVGCEYENNLQVGGRMDVQPAAIIAEKVALGWYPVGADTDHPPMRYTCFWQINEAQSRYTEGPGFIGVDPKFVDPDSFNFNLCWDSPCINAGDGSRDGLTVTDMGAFEYPIQVSHFSVNASGLASWQWHNGFQAVSQRVMVRWHAQRYPIRHDDPADVTAADVAATATSAQTNKTAGFFAAFVMDANGAWSGPTPDGVHRFHIEGSTPSNHPPVLAPVGSRSVPAGRQLKITVEGTDVDENALQYSASGG